MKLIQVMLEKCWNHIQRKWKSASGGKEENWTSISAGNSQKHVLNIKGLRGDLGKINEAFEYFAKGSLLKIIGLST